MQRSKVPFVRFRGLPQLASAFLLVGLVAWVSAAAEPAQTPVPAAQQGAKIDYATQIKPILEARCFECHGAKLQRADLRFDDRASAFQGGDSGEKAIIPGDAANSKLIKMVTEKDPAKRMPRKQAPLSDQEIGLLKSWIQQGADWPVEGVKQTHWSLKPVTKPMPPTVADGGWGRNEIDAFLAAELKKAGLKGSPEADRRTLIRRLYATLLGISPTDEQTRAFLADASPDAYERLVDELLASPRFGEKWARHWLDVVRFAETTGFETNVDRPNAWHYRDYVIESFNSDKPYARFVMEQIAGDELGEDAATGFLVGGAWDQVKSPDINLTLQQRQDELADMINTTGTSFMGLTLGCARCHNHKFDPISQKDYYAMQAIFAGVQHADRPRRSSESIARQKQIDELNKLITSVQNRMANYEPASFGGRTVLVDETAAAARKPSGKAAGLSGAKLLAKPQATVPHQAGKGRGQLEDAGDLDRMPNLSRAYTWFNAAPGQDLVVWSPGAPGRYRVWISWGCGFTTHASDAVYLLDVDGDPATRADQKSIAVIDQRKFAGAAAEPAGQALFSGFADGGVHEFTAGSVVLLRAGSAASAVTADMLVFQEEADAAQVAAQAKPRTPHLRPPVHPMRNVDRFEPVMAKFVRFTVEATNQSEPCIDELEIYTAGEGARNIALASEGAKPSSSGDYPGSPIHQLSHINDGKYGNDRSWISNTNGRGWVQIELPQAVMIDRVVWGRERAMKFKDRLATRYVIEVATEPGKWRKVSGSQDRQPFVDNQPLRGNVCGVGLTVEEARSMRELQSELGRWNEQVEKLRVSLTSMVYAGSFTQPGPTYRLFRGDPMARKEKVEPAAIESLSGDLGLNDNSPESRRRMALARWIADEKNPLTARVIVNRLWHHHFGMGIVPTPGDFGANGMKPTHPQLLDFMASRLMEEQWSLKALHRLIVTSAAFRQSSAPDAQALKVDAQATLLWRYPARRMDAEGIRDRLLQAAGTLDLRMGGRGYSVFEPNDNYVRLYKPLKKFGPPQWRRMIYMTKVRMEHDSTFGAFDCPDAGQTTNRRFTSTTALQSLNLFNSPFVIEQAEFMARRVEREAGAQASAQAGRAFEIAFGRRADEQELAWGVEAIGRLGLSMLCRVLVNGNEFVYIE